MSSWISMKRWAEEAQYYEERIKELEEDRTKLMELNSKLANEKEYAERNAAMSQEEAVSLLDENAKLLKRVNRLEIHLARIGREIGYDD